MTARVEQPPIVMLAMYLDQRLPELAQQAGRDRLIVDEGPAAAVGPHQPAHHQRVARLRGKAIVGEQRVGGMGGRQLEGHAHRRLRLAAADQAAVRPRAKRQPERVEQDRLARPGFAGEHAEAAAELQVQRLDQHHVAN